MLDGIHNTYTEKGVYLGEFQDGMRDTLLVCDYIYNKVSIGDVLLLEESRAHRAKKVKVTEKRSGSRRGNELIFSVEATLPFPIKKQTTKESLEHIIVDFLRIGKNKKAVKAVTKILHTVRLA